MAVEPQRPSHEPGSPPVLKYGRHAHRLPPAAHHVIHHNSAAFDADSTLTPVLEPKQADDPVHDGAAEHEVRVSHASPSVCQAQHQPAIFKGGGGFVCKQDVMGGACTRMCVCVCMCFMRTAKNTHLCMDLQSGCTPVGTHPGLLRKRSMLSMGTASMFLDTPLLWRITEEQQLHIYEHACQFQCRSRLGYVHPTA